ncbi:MAG: polymer-forming cytoskeletal protein [Lachnospiraceae bacterium]|nr:polymer-forming cytoskeletal protein [Lachnospiraceae bacterium]
MLGKTRSTAAAATEPSGKISTIIGPGAVFDGNLASPENIRIDGTVNGNCNCQQKLVVGPEGTVKGNITSQSLMVSGKIDGDVLVHGKLELLSTGNIHGNITTKSLIVDEGGCFDGKCIMTESVPESLPEPFIKATDTPPEEEPADSSK